MIDFTKPIWAAGPMVRASVLPFRLMCLEYGADVVYTEEISATHLRTCSRTVTAEGYVTFRRPDGALVFSTCAAERGRVILQLGAACPETATAAAQLVKGDIAGIDLNMGCPKTFSVARGMGASLVTDLARAEKILKALRQVLPSPLTLTAKIRLMLEHEETLQVVKKCFDCGCDAVAVHCRTKDQRPSRPALWPPFAALRAAVPDANRLLLNGDLLGPEEILAALNCTGYPSVMMSRAAMKRPWLFKLKKQLLAVEGPYKSPLPAKLYENAETPEEAVKKLLTHVSRQFQKFAETDGVMRGVSIAQVVGT